LSRRIHMALDLSAIIFYAASIFAMSSMSIEQTRIRLFPGADKVVHAILYTGLGMLLCRFFANDLRRSPAAAMLLAATLGALYGLSDEIHQHFVPKRTASAFDFLADVGGVAVALALWYLFARRRRRPALLLVASPATQEGEDAVQV
jgi:hypothetical protein